MELLVLGPLELRADGAVVPIRRGRPRRLLLALLLRAGRPVLPERLIEELWGDHAPKNAANALQILISYLRKVLPRTADGMQVLTTSRGYQLDLGSTFVDAHHFAHVVTRPVAGGPVERAASLRDALALWRGPPYAEVAYEDFAQPDILRINELRLDALEAHTDALLEMGNHQAALGALRPLVVEQPLRERFHEQLMMALYRSGRQADALAAFDGVRRLFRDELGLEPGPELRALQKRILDHDPALLSTAALVHERAMPVPAPVPVAPASPRRPRVPADDTVGRGDAIEALRGLVEARRLVTLTGPGGSGKTRLAAEVATAVGQVWWVDLSSVTDAPGVLAALAAGTGAPLEHDDAGTALIGHLRDQDGVLVIDTCEHLLDALRDPVTELLAETPVTVLATSRRPLRLSDEFVWPVPPLALPDPHRLTFPEVLDAAAVQLFSRRASSVNAGFQVTADNAADVGRVCLLLDGLPLAIELAAGHVGVLTPSAILRLLDDRFRLLASDAGTGRHQTLRATIDWSYDRLSEEERVFLNRLSVFAGGFPLEAAIAVGGHDLDDDGLTLLLALANQSLVSISEDDRFRLLDTIRAYAVQHLDADEEAAARTRHAQWYRGFAEDAGKHLRGPDAQGWLDEIRTELANLRSALTWSFSPDGDGGAGAATAAALTWFWAVEGLSGEATRWLSAAAAAAEPGGRVAASLLNGRGMHAASMGDLQSAVVDCTRAVEIFREHDDRRGEAHALIYLGIAHWGSGQLRDAAAVHDKAIALFRELGEDWGFAISLVLRGRTATDLGEPGATDLLDAALPIARRAGDAHLIAMCMEQRAVQGLIEGEPELAAAWAAESLDWHERIGHTEGTVASLHTLGLALAAGGTVDEAEELHHRGLRLSRDTDHPGGLADGLECLALIAVARGEHAAAVRTFAAADTFRDQRSIPRPPSRHALLAPARTRAETSLDDVALRRAVAAGRLLDPFSLIRCP